MGRNPLIDGFRGLSIGLVIIGHLMQFRFLDYLQAPSVLSSRILPTSSLSSLLILVICSATSAFIYFHYQRISDHFASSARRADARLGQCASVYTRRIFRILPAFYAYLLAILALTLIGVIHVPYADILRSGAFLTDLHRFSPHWFVGHTWSLSVEEQFYILWPALLIVFAKARGWLGLACFVGLLALSAFSPLAGRFSYIAIGALYAMSPRVKQEIDAIGARPWAPLLALGLFAIAFLPPGLVVLGKILVAAGPVLLAILFFGALTKGGPLCRLVSLVWLQRLGLISYSVYLWQQPR